MSLIKTRGKPDTSGKALDEAAAHRGPSTTGIAFYRDKVKIDRHALDVAAEEHPQLFLEILEKHVQAVSRQAQAQDEMVRLDSGLARKVREELVAKGTKTTEGMIADFVLVDPEHVAASAKVAAAKIEVDEWAALKSAFEHRKSMIRELAQLYFAGYYSTTGGAKSKTRDADAAVNRERITEARNGG